MSNRAEGLAKNILETCDDEHIYDAMLLIDAELRKTLERAADRASSYLNTLNAREDCTHDGLRDAILAEEEV